LADILERQLKLSLFALAAVYSGRSLSAAKQLELLVSHSPHKVPQHGIHQPSEPAACRYAQQPRYE
jgi:hypothetical protein